MKFIFTLILSIVSCLCYAQVADTYWGESMSSVYNKVSNRFAQVYETHHSVFVVLEEYAGYEWTHINFDFKDDEYSNARLNKISLSKSFNSLGSAKNFLYTLKADLNYDFKNSENKEDRFYSFEDSNDSTDINLYVCKVDESSYDVYLTYEDNNLKYNIQTITSILNILSIGDSYDNVKYTLHRYFGKCFDSYRGNITYSNIFFAELWWDYAFFNFDYDTSTSHLESIILVKHFDDYKDAISFRDSIKSPNVFGVNLEKCDIQDNGFKSYSSDENEGYDCIDMIRKVGKKYSVAAIIKSKESLANDKL